MAQTNVTASKPVQLPCPILAEEMGIVAQEIQKASSASQKLQLEKILQSLEVTYEKQCAGKKSEDLAKTVNVAASVELIGGTLLLNLIHTQGNEVQVIIGGADGPLVTINGKGVISVLPSQGPGDPEIRKAVASIAAGLQTLIGGVTKTASVR
jgi:hypothetical protein